MRARIEVRSGTPGTEAADVSSSWTTSPGGVLDAAPASVRLLGGFGVVVDADPVDLGPRGQQVLALVALRRRVGRHELAATLWPDSVESRAAASLRTELWRIGSRAPGLLRQADDRLALGPGACVDVLDLVRRGRLLLDPSTPLSAAEIGGPWRLQELLPGWEHAWLGYHRERVRQLGMHACEAAARRLVELGEHRTAREHALVVLQADPLRRSAYRTLAHVLLAAGDPAAADRVREACGRALWREQVARRTGPAVRPSPVQATRSGYGGLETGLRPSSTTGASGPRPSSTTGTTGPRPAS